MKIDDLAVMIEENTDMINEFSGTYAFLSNFFVSPLQYEGKEWQTVEHLFQAQKSVHDAERYLIMIITQKHNCAGIKITDQRFILMSTGKRLLINSYSLWNTVLFPAATSVNRTLHGIQALILAQTTKTRSCF